MQLYFLLVHAKAPTYTMLCFHKLSSDKLFLVSKQTYEMIFSEKALVERALDLRAELENAASDMFSLFAKIGLYT